MLCSITELSPQSGLGTHTAVNWWQLWIFMLSKIGNPLGWFLITYTSTQLEINWSGHDREGKQYLLSMNDWLLKVWVSWLVYKYWYITTIKQLSSLLTSKLLYRLCLLYFKKKLSCEMMKYQRMLEHDGVTIGVINRQSICMFPSDLASYLLKEIFRGNDTM